MVYPKGLFIVLLSLSKQIPGKHIRLGYGHFLPHPSQFVIVLTILTFDATESGLLTALSKYKQK